jgi:hypothetical protein
MQEITIKKMIGVDGHPSDASRGHTAGVAVFHNAGRVRCCPLPGLPGRRSPTGHDRKPRQTADGGYEEPGCDIRVLDITGSTCLWNVWGGACHWHHKAYRLWPKAGLEIRTKLPRKRMTVSRP